MGAGAPGQITDVATQKQALDHRLYSVGGTNPPKADLCGGPLTALPSTLPLPHSVLTPGVQGRDVSGLGRPGGILELRRA